MFVFAECHEGLAGGNVDAYREIRLDLFMQKWRQDLSKLRQVPQLV